MRPLPTSPDHESSARADEAGATRILELGAPSAANQRRTSCATQRAYPWLLAGSTAMAGVFCVLYLSKPVIVTETRTAGSRATASLPGISQTPARPAPAAVPSDDFLPGDESARPEPTAPRDLAALGEATFEETNLRIQHVLGAQGPAAEDLGRIVLEVPVLYRSGTLRWSREDVAKARSLLVRLDEYQQKSRELRDEAATLIREWDDLIYVSIPETSLRADSPTLPDNQGIGTAGDATLNTTESIEIEH